MLLQKWHAALALGNDWVVWPIFTPSVVLDWRTLASGVVDSNAENARRDWLNPA